MLSLDALVGARAVSAYSALPGEISTSAIVRALLDRAVTVVLPRASGAELALHRVSAQTPLVAGPWQVLEPPEGAPAIAAGAIDLFLVPGLLFDRRGRRLGRGGGHFDRLLARARPGAWFVGVCHASRVVDALPEDPWDVRMHRIVSTAEVIVIERGGE